MLGQIFKPQNPKISILVPCYNVEKYLAECLSSLLIQSLKEIEIICINDGSTDGTSEILKSFQKQDSRVQVINKTNSGYGDSMNIGLFHSRGLYVGIVESDDFVEPSMFEDLFLCAQKYNLDVVRSGYFVYQDGRDILTQLNPDIPKEKIIKPIEYTRIFSHAPAIWTSIYNRNFIYRNNIQFLPTPGASFQDRSFAFKVLYCSERFMMINKAYLHYRQHSTNSVKSFNKIYCICNEWEEIFKFISDNPQYLAEIKPILVPLSLKTFRWNFRKLNKKYRNEFLKACTSLYKKYNSLITPIELLSNIDRLEYLALTQYPNNYSLFLKLKHLFLRHIFR